MSANVLQITTEDLRKLVDELVEVKLATIFRNPEDDLEFTDELQEIIAHQDERIKNGDRGEPMADVIERLGIN